MLEREKQLKKSEVESKNSQIVKFWVEICSSCQIMIWKF